MVIKLWKWVFVKENINIWDQCHFAYSRERFVVFCLEQVYSQPATDCGLKEEAFYKHCSPRSISFNDTAIERNFILDVDQRSFLKICCQLDGNLNIYIFSIIEPCLTRSQVYHSDRSATTEQTNLMLLFLPSKLRKLI